MHKPCSSSSKPTVSGRQTRTSPNSYGEKEGLSVFHSLLLVVLILGACARIPGPPQHIARREAGPAIQELELKICAPCSREEARQWAADAEEDVGSALKAANCYAFLAKTGGVKTSRLADAKTGRRLAETAVKRRPKSAVGHYLCAYLTGLEAENDPLRGLELVPVIEREARAASELNPGLDQGGPHRMLGELYLRAPGIPVSIGDMEKAVACYRRALAAAPHSSENRLGLAEALLNTGEVTEACIQLHELLSGMPPAGSSQDTWRQALGLLKRLCTAKNDG